MFKILNFGMKTLLFEQEPGLQIEITDSDFPLQYFELFFMTVITQISDETKTIC